MTYRPIKIALRSKIRKAVLSIIDIQQLTSLVAAFRVETEKESILPEAVGSILQAIADLLSTATIERCLHFSTKKLGFIRIVVYLWHY